MESIADELLKFKNLLDMGVLTQEEFDAQKNKLLSGSVEQTATAPESQEPPKKESQPDKERFMRETADDKKRITKEAAIAKFENKKGY